MSPTFVIINVHLLLSTRHTFIYPSLVLKLHSEAIVILTLIFIIGITFIFIKNTLLWSKQVVCYYYYIKPQPYLLKNSLYHVTSCFSNSHFGNMDRLYFNVVLFTLLFIQNIYITNRNVNITTINYILNVRVKLTCQIIDGEHAYILHVLM